MPLCRTEAYLAAVFCLSIISHDAAPSSLAYILALLRCTKQIFNYMLESFAQSVHIFPEFLEPGVSVAYAQGVAT